ncbi:MAG: hypothetical protein H7239_00810 [Flavobacterium sp.]|nr:hypothetical protein [Flavobacterium sp.]
MRTIKFDAEELQVLKEIILLGDSQYANSFPEISKLINSKIRIDFFQFTKQEIQVLKSYSANWLNNYDELVDELREKYWEKTNIDYMSISEFEKEKMKKISTVFSIKSKLFLESYITFKKVLDQISN